MTGQTPLGRVATLALCLIGAVLVAACEGDDPGGAGGGGGAGGAGGAGGYEDPEVCPDPEDPDVAYLSQDPAACEDVDLGCTDDEFGFFSGCGCGCIQKGGLGCPGIEDPEIEWLATDPARCEETPPACGLGYIGFSNSCGCGCLPR